MAIHSMTGFARSEGANASTSWVWEVRSVNGRGLDVRLRLPPGLDDLEPAVREAVTKALTRGNVSATLTCDRGTSSAGLRLNDVVLADVLAAADRIAAMTGGPKPTPAELINVKGVLEPGDQGSACDAAAVAAREALHAAILQTLSEALTSLIAARRAEGARLEQAMRGSISEVEDLVGKVRAHPSMSADAIAARLRETVSRLVGASNDALDPERLHQEAVLAATRGDVEEELVRLTAHCAAARDHLAATGAIGRKLDFLAQEFNREANTLCSKAVSIDVTRHGLALKSAIDQLREQIQNIE